MMIGCVVVDVMIGCVVVDVMIGCVAVDVMIGCVVVDVMIGCVVYMMIGCVFVYMMIGSFRQQPNGASLKCSCRTELWDAIHPSVHFPPLIRGRVTVAAG